MTDFDTKHESGWVLTHIPSSNGKISLLSAEPPTSSDPRADDTGVSLDDDDLCVEVSSGRHLVCTYIPIDVVRWLLARHAEDTAR